MLKQLAGQTAVYGMGTVLPRFLNYLLFPYLTRMMTTAEYGVVGELYGWIPLFLVILTLGLETGFFRFAGKAETDTEKRNVFATAWGGVTAAALLFFVIVMLLTPQLSVWMNYADHPSFIRLTGILITIDAISAIPFCRLRQQGRPGLFSKLKLLSVVVQLLFTFFFYSFLPGLAQHSGGFWATIYDPSFGVGYLLVANILGSLVALIGLWPAYRDTPPRFHWKQLRVMLLYSFPLLLSGIAGMGNETVDRVLMKYILPEEIALSSLGIYNATLKLGVLLTLCVQMYRYAAEPYFLSSFKKEDFLRANATVMKYFVLVAIGIALVLLLYTDLFALLMGKDFREGVFVLPLVLLANICTGIILNLSFWYKQIGATRYAIWITGSGFVVILGLNLLLVPKLGYYGAAWARLICEVAMVAISFLLNQKYYRTPYDLRRIGSYFLLGGLIWATTLVSGVLPDWMRYAFNLLLLLLYARYVMRIEKINVRELWQSITRRGK